MSNSKQFVSLAKTIVVENREVKFLSIDDKEGNEGIFLDNSGYASITKFNNEEYIPFAQLLKQLGAKSITLNLFSEVLNRNANFSRSNQQSYERYLAILRMLENFLKLLVFESIDIEQKKEIESRIESERLCKVLDYQLR